MNSYPMTGNSRSGFTLLEVLVATVIMGIAVAGLIAGLSQSVRNASRLGDYDRAAMLARTRMNELLLDPTLPLTGTLSGEFDKEESGGVASGWQVSVKPFEMRPGAAAGSIILQEIALQVWWQPATAAAGSTRRTLQLAGYRQARIPAGS